MSHDDDWQTLGAAWRDGAAIDPAPVVRKLRRQRLRTLIMVGLELLALVLGSVELIKIGMNPGSERWSSWAWVMLGGLWVFQGYLIYLRRRPWRQPTLTPGSLVEHTVTRARTAIRLAWLNLIVMAVLALFGLGFAIMRWTEPAMHRPILICAGFALGFVVAFSIGARRYLRKQRQTIAAAQRLATELTDPRPGS